MESKEITRTDIATMTDEDLGYTMVDIAYAELKHMAESISINEVNWCQLSNELPSIYRIILLPSILEGEVMNGGLIQYFNNHEGSHNIETRLALASLNAVDYLSIFNNAISVFEREFSLFQCAWQIDEANGSLEGFTSLYDKEALAELDQLDGQFYAIEDNEPIVQYIGRYARAHINDYFPMQEQP